MELEGRTVIVTGAGSGIGRALTVEFARNGVRVVCCGSLLTIRLVTFHAPGTVPSAPPSPCPLPSRERETPDAPEYQ